MLPGLPIDGPLIQGLLGTSRTFLGTPHILNEVPKSWLGRILHRSTKKTRKTLFKPIGRTLLHLRSRPFHKHATCELLSRSCTRIPSLSLVLYLVFCISFLFINGIKYKHIRAQTCMHSVRRQQDRTVQRMEKKIPAAFDLLISYFEFNLSILQLC